MVDIKNKQKNIEQKLLKSHGKSKVKSIIKPLEESNIIDDDIADKLQSEMDNNNIILNEEDSDLEDVVPEYVVIGCKLPNGVVIRVGQRNYLLRGTNDMPGNGDIRHYGGIGFTKIDKKIWQQFLVSHEQWAPIINGSVFISHNQDFWWEGSS